MTKTKPFGISPGGLKKFSGPNWSADKEFHAVCHKCTVGLSAEISTASDHSTAISYAKILSYFIDEKSKFL